MYENAKQVNTCTPIVADGNTLVVFRTFFLSLFSFLQQNPLSVEFDMTGAATIENI